MVIGLIAINSYNNLVRLRNRYKNAYGQIDIQLQRRYDLIPNLVETAKGYLKHEKETLEAVILARNAAITASDRAATIPGDSRAMQRLGESEAMLTDALNKLMVISEAYPELKSDRTMNRLMEELTSTENKIAFARQAFNDSITFYNTQREVFPSNLIATSFNFQAANLLPEISAEVKAVPKTSAFQDTEIQRVCLIKKVTSGEKIKSASGWWDSSLFFWVSLITTTVVGGASLYRIQKLKQGGAIVAAEMGGRIVLPETATETEQQLLNIVEEMALAAGLPVPYVFVLEREHGINAFAAGDRIENAVIGVTKGALDTFNRDELQSVIGHEFSHILNGDMKLNIRISGIIYGLIVVYITGKGCLYLRTERNTALPRILLGFSLMIIGGIGLLWGKIIKSAISRQREFLADASSVQFTRNPEAMVSALRKILECRFGTIICSPHAESHSHMFFGNVFRFGSFSLFDTHPPLEERIRRIEGKISKLRSTTPKTAIDRVNLPHNINTEGIQRYVTSKQTQVEANFPNWISKLPSAIQEFLADSEQAVNIIFALSLNSKNILIYERQKLFIRENSSLNLEKILEIESAINALDFRLYLSIVNYLLPTLSDRELEIKQQWLKILSQLGQINGDWSVKTFSLYLTLKNACQLTEIDEQYQTIEPIWVDCLKVISILAQLEESDRDRSIYVFRTGAFRLPQANQNTISENPFSYNLDSLESSLKQISKAEQKLKQNIAYAFVETVMSKGKITELEGILLGAIIWSLNCPIPPFLQAK